MKRDPRRVINFNFPAAKFSCHTPRKATVRGHQRTGHGGIFKGVAHHHRNGGGFFARTRTIHPQYAAQNVWGEPGNVTPMMGGFGRAQGFARQTAALNRDITVAPQRRPGQNTVRTAPDMAQCLVQKMLGMGGVILNGGPVFMANSRHQAGQNHAPLGHGKNRRHQIAQGRERPGGADNQHRCLRDIVLPQFNLCLDQRITPHRPVADVLSCQNTRPMQGQDLQEF